MSRSNKCKYIDLCGCVDNIPIFSQDWWLDSVTIDKGMDWDVCIVEKNNRIVGALPYVFKKKYGKLIIIQPLLTQSLFPWIQCEHDNYTKTLSRRKKVLSELIKAIPRNLFFYQEYHYSLTDWQPFFWKNYKQTTNYTYILNLKYTVDDLWSRLSQNIKGDIKKSEKRFGIEIVNDDGVDQLYSLLEKTFGRQDKQTPYSKKFLSNIDVACKLRGCRSIYLAKDQDEKVHAAVYIVRDHNTSYYLVGGGDPELRNSGATSLCLWRAICNEKDRSHFFDFEGSMIQGVERFFRGFGAEQISYFSIQKANPLLEYIVKNKKIRKILKLFINR